MYVCRSSNNGPLPTIGDESVTETEHGTLNERSTINMTAVTLGVE